MTTLNDIARRAGCSPATVSRAMNGTAVVRPETHATITAAVRELGDHGLAGGRRRLGRPRGSLQKSDKVDVVVFRHAGLEPLTASAGGVSVSAPLDEAPADLFSSRYNLSNDYYRHIIDGAVSVLATQGMKAVHQFRKDLLDASFIRELNESRGRGVLLLGEPSEQVQAFASRCEKPLVLVDILGVSGRPVVVSDNVGGIRSMLRHLIDLGHRDIGFTGYSANPSYGERRMSFCGQMMEAGLAVNPEWQYDCPSHIADVSRGVRSMLARKSRPTAIMCCSDWVAMGVMQAARDVGLDVPGDLSVGGFDDMDAAALLTPPLTTVQAPTRALGAQAVRLLLSDMSAWEAGAPWGCEVRIRTNLVVRRSTAAPQR